MCDRNQVLLFGSFDNIVHGDESLLDLLQETMLSAKCWLFILFELFNNSSEFNLNILLDVVFSALSEETIRINPLLNCHDQPLLIMRISLHLINFDPLHSLALFFRLVKDLKVLGSMVLDLADHVVFDRENFLFELLESSVCFIVLGVSFLAIKKYRVFHRI